MGVCASCSSRARKSAQQVVRVHSITLPLLCRRLGRSLNGQARRSGTYPGKQVTWVRFCSTKGCETKPPRPPTCRGQLNEQALEGNLLGSLLRVSYQGLDRIIPKGAAKHPGTGAVEALGSITPFYRLSAETSSLSSFLIFAHLGQPRRRDGDEPVGSCRIAFN